MFCGLSVRCLLLCRNTGGSKYIGEPTLCLFQVYHVSSDSYETQNQHYGRSLTKETVKDGKGIGVSELSALGFFHLNIYL